MKKQKNIFIKGARVNNLKNISLEIPRKKLVLITGVSGSGKSSLAFDTLYAEGQRRYVESLSSYARQFLARMEKPDVDYIQGISPAMAIEQRVGTSNPRSTVGTTTEIYDLFKLLFARLGKTYSPVSGEQVKRDTVSDVVDYMTSQKDGTKMYVYAELPVRKQGLVKEWELALQKGFTRVLFEGQVTEIEDLLDQAGNDELPKTSLQSETFFLLIDRIKLSKPVDESMEFRFADSVQTAYQEGDGSCFVEIADHEPKLFSRRFERDGIEFELPSVNLFSFNNPYGACKKCEGFGRVLGIDRDLVVPDKSKSLYEGAIAPWRGERMGKYLEKFIEAAADSDFPIHRPYFELSEEQQDQVWDGLGFAEGINDFFDFVQSKLHKIQYRVMLSRYRGYTTCPDCKGSRIRKDANYVKVGSHTISELLFMELEQLQDTFKRLDIDEREKKIAERLLREINNRLDYLVKVGVGYLTLNRRVGTLSGGEMQRIKLATSLGSGLVGAMYILDEPSIGLHPRDTDKLIEVLESLRDIGNSVIVVEHDEGIIRKADNLVDIGPGAGELGGEVIFQGTFDEVLEAETLTGRYLSGRDEIEIPAVRRRKTNSIKLLGARAHNLKNVDAEFPLNALTVVTGVSGSGKTTLIKGVLYPALKRHLEEYGERPGEFTGLEGDLSLLHGIEMVDQSPIGRSARSNPATYIKAWDPIRDLYANQQIAKVKGMKPGFFSFNVDGGRCEVCKGEGTVTIEMQFLPDITLTCDNCKGKRFKRNVLDVKYKGKNIDDVLNMTIHEAWQFFSEVPKISKKLEILNKVGLGYLRMGQSSTTLSGGEAQRVKLASFLAQGGKKSGTLYIFDEPTTGLHFDDIKKLLISINALVERGNTVIIVEHNLEVIKCADWIIDLGPEGGKGGGDILFQGRPEDLVKVENSHTARYLEEKVVPV